MAKLSSICLSVCCLLASAIDGARNEENTLFFDCYSSYMSRDVLVFFDTVGGWSSSRLVSDQHLQLYREILTRASIIEEDFDPSELVSFQTSCSLATVSGEVSIPVSVYWKDGDRGFEFGVADVSPSSSLLAGNLTALAIQSEDWVGLGHKNWIHASTGNELPSDSVGCPGKQSVSPAVLAGENEWKVQVSTVDIVGSQRNSSVVSEGTVAVISSAAHGIFLPTGQFDAFLRAYPTSSSVPMRVEGDSIYIPNCILEGRRVAAMIPELVVGFEGQEAFRFSPQTFLEEATDKECRVTVFRSSSAEITLGDSLFAAGFVQLARDRQLTICPHRMLSSPDRLSRPVETPASATDEVVGGNSGIVLGVAIGGSVLILALIVGFVIRAKRKKRVDRFSASRPMVADPSISDAASEPSSEHVRV